MHDKTVTGVTRPPNPFVHFWTTSRPLRLLRGNRLAMVALGFLVFVILLAAFGGMLAPYDPNAQDLSNSFAPASGSHWLGTDIYGRDMLSRLLDAASVTLAAIVQAVGVAAVLGIPFGLFAGLVGGAVGTVLSRISDALQSLPPLILAIAIVGILGPGLTNAMLAIGIVLAPSLFRLARGAAESVATETYIEACRALGCSQWRLLWRHVLPNAASPILVQLTFSAGVAIVAEASLSFLGLGVQSPQTSWGSMLRDAFDNVYTAPTALIAPAIMIVATVLAFSTFGDGLRDALEGTGTTRKTRLLSRNK
ncbi:MAG: ABC transporter permease [Rhodococcus sp. (in: high G+C Gram-positive bacteria)]|uniref:ABC transporter permease n=1 Tax=Rhodococcus sp. TaxID=1831 RepID=UPI00120E5282|nr:ABC transporter permease [Rhodococcus sp. (in: high G+C Gram-positive bacteria)]RZL25432.1 MAG: ABC transporter permease [Rhodococcus sp. (in: high G+C Gram-positive bacteria)]